jgi:hypothetical protein
MTCERHNSCEEERNASTLRVEGRWDGRLLVGVEYFTGLCEVINMFVGIGLKGLEEGRRGVYEEHALPPACRHGGQDREGGGRGGKGWKEKECSVGSDAFLLVRFPSLRGNSPGARRVRRFTSHIFTTIITVLLSLSSTATLRFVHGRRWRSLIVKYFLDNRIAATRVTLGPRVGNNK